MKISPAMTDAGVAAMARARRSAKPTDEALVNVVYSAMEARREMEAKLATGAIKEAPYSHQDWPSWRYGPNGEAQVFASAEDVPEGWGVELPKADMPKLRLKPGPKPKGSVDERPAH